MHLRCFDGEPVTLPRYGLPAPHQIPWLPPDYNPNQPPPYHGAPKLPYILGPAIFNPKVFAALLHYEKPDTHHDQEELLSNSLPVGEVAYKGK
jgi:hypothetical protein